MSGRAILVGLALAASGCTAALPILGAGPERAHDVGLLEHALVAAELAGYRALDVDAEHGRFVVIAQADGTGRTRFEVQCFQEGYLSIVPHGPDVDLDGRRYRLPPRLRDEYLELARELDRVVAVRP